MNIALKMKIQNQEFTLNVNLTNAAGRIYRQQYNRDILKDMSEIYKKMHRSYFDGINMDGIEIDGKTEQEIFDQLLSRVDVPKLLKEKSEIETLSFEETDRCGQIVWAFAKNADKDTPYYEEWIDNFDFILPVIDIVCELYEAWNKSAQPTIELKN